MIATASTSQASMGPTADQITRVQSIGYSAWLDEQFAQATTTSRWDWLVGAGFSDITFRNNENGFDSSAWRKLLSSPDTLGAAPDARLCMRRADRHRAHAVGGFGRRATTKAQYLAKSVPLPPKLFSHNDQQSVWQSSSPEGAVSGWGGRMGDLFESGNGNATFTCVNVSSNAVFLSGHTAVQYQVSPSGPAALNAAKNPLFGSATCL